MARIPDVAPRRLKFRSDNLRVTVADATTKPKRCTCGRTHYHLVGCPAATSAAVTVDTSNVDRDDVRTERERLNAELKAEREAKNAAYQRYEQQKKR